MAPAAMTTGKGKASFLNTKPYGELFLTADELIEKSRAKKAPRIRDVDRLVFAPTR